MPLPSPRSARFALRVALVAAPALLAACSREPNPVIARDPIAPPPPGYTVACAQHPFIFNAWIANCVPVQPTVEQRTVVRVKG